MVYIFGAIGFAIGYVMVAIFQFLWRHKGWVVVFLFVCMIVGLISDAVDVAANGTIAERTSNIHMTLLETRDVATRDAGYARYVFDVRITNDGDRVLKEFVGHCGEHKFEDNVPIPAHSTVVRSYDLTVQADPLGACAFNDAVLS